MEKEITLNFKALQESIYRLNSKDFIKRKNIKTFEEETENKFVLKMQSIIFDCFLNTNIQFSNLILTERFINQTLEIISNVNWSDIIKENKEIRISYLDNAYVGSTIKKDDLYNAIHTLIECRSRNNPNKNLNKEQKSYEFLINYLMSERQNSKLSLETNEPKFSKKFITNYSLSSFYDRYEHITGKDKEFISVLLSKNKLFHVENIKKEFELNNNKIYKTIENIDELIFYSFYLIK